jgi:PAS domain-containing protein
MKDTGRSGERAAGTRAEEILHESEDKYRFLIDATGTGYVILDDRGGVVDANLEYVRMTGRDGLV